MSDPRTPQEILETAEEIAPRLARLAAGNDRAGVFPHESIRILHDARLLTVTVGVRHGGPGVGHAGVQRLLTVLGRADPAVALIASLTLAVHQREARAPFLPDVFYRQLLAESAREPVLVNSLQVEPQLGTPSRGGIPHTTARRVPGGWRLHGHKVFSTGAAGLRWMLVLAATDEAEPRIGSFVVDAREPGVEVLATWAAAGMRATVSDDVLLDGAFVPDHLALGLSDAQGGHVNPAGPGTAIPSVYLGVAQAARDWLVRFLRSRVPANLGHPLLELPRFEAELGELELRLTVADELLRSLAAREDAGGSVTREQASAVKTEANRAAIAVVERAVALIGNPGISRDNPLERHLRDVLCARVHFPQEDTVLTALGRVAASRAPEPDRELVAAVSPLARQEPA